MKNGILHVLIFFIYILVYLPTYKYYSLKDSIKIILYVRMSIPHSEVNVMEYLSVLSWADIVIGRGKKAPECWDNVTFSSLGKSARDVIRKVVLLRKICCTSDRFVPPSFKSLKSINLPVADSLIK